MKKTKDYLALKFLNKRFCIREGNLGEMHFENLDLSQLDFSDANFWDSTFSRCIFSQSIFSRCHFRNAVIKDCIGEMAIFADSNFVGAEIINAKFDNSFFTRCYLGGDFSARKTSFIRVNFIGSDFTGAYPMSGSSFDDCCLDSVAGLGQDVLKKMFWQGLNNGQGWRAIDAITNKSLLGKSLEKVGSVIKIPKNEVSLDPRAGCKSGLHICRTKSLADEFGREHYKNYKLIPIDFSFDNILVVHLSGDFCRVNEYKVKEIK